MVPSSARMVTMFCSFSRWKRLPAGHQESALLVGDVGDDAGDGGAVDVDVENVEEDTDAGVARPPDDADDTAIGGREGDGADGEQALGIAKKPGAEKSKSKERERDGGPEEPGYQGAAEAKADEVENPVTNHAVDPFYRGDRPRLCTLAN